MEKKLNVPDTVHPISMTTGCWRSRLLSVSHQYRRYGEGIDKKEQSKIKLRLQSGVRTARQRNVGTSGSTPPLIYPSTSHESPLKNLTSLTIPRVSRVSWVPWVSQKIFHFLYVLQCVMSFSRPMTAQAVNIPQQESVILNFVFFDNLNPLKHPRSIEIPHSLFNRPAQECRDLFSDAVSKKFRCNAENTSISFWRVSGIHTSFLFA